MQRIYSIILFLGLFIPLAAQEVEGNVKLNEGMPVFKIIHDEGSELTFSPYLNKILLITFFQSWCESCQHILNDIEKNIWPEYKDYADFTLLPIGVSHTDDELKKYKEDNDFSFPLYPDPVGEIFNTFALGEKVPRIYLVEKNNKVIFLSEGYSTKDFITLRNTLRKITNLEPVYDDPLQEEQ